MLVISANLSPEALRIRQEWLSWLLLAGCVIAPGGTQASVCLLPSSPPPPAHACWQATSFTRERYMETRTSLFPTDCGGRCCRCPKGGRNVAPMASVEGPRGRNWAFVPEVRTALVKHPRVKQIRWPYCNLAGQTWIRLSLASSCRSYNFRRMPHEDCGAPSGELQRPGCPLGGGQVGPDAARGARALGSGQEQFDFELLAPPLPVGPRGCGQRIAAQVADARTQRSLSIAQCKAGEQWEESQAMLNAATALIPGVAAALGRPASSSTRPGRQAVVGPASCLLFMTAFHLPGTSEVSWGWGGSSSGCSCVSQPDSCATANARRWPSWL